MKLKGLVFLAVLLIAVPAAFSQDNGGPDSVKLVVTSGTPTQGLPTQPFNVACSVLVDADALASMTFGWKWDNPDLQIDSAKAFGDFAALNLIFFYLDDQRAKTNDSQIALFNGVSFGSGYPTASVWRHCVTYYMTLSNWTSARGSINIDTVTHPSYVSTEYIFAPVSGNPYFPIWRGPINVTTSGVNESNTDLIPNTFELAQNYPNPFNPATMIRFGLPTKSQVTVTVYNLLGQEITTLVDEVLPAGTHSKEWDGRDKKGAEVATGIYFYKLVAGDFVDTKKMMLIK